VLGSIFTSLYADRIGSGAFALLPDPVRQAAQDSVAAAIGATEQATGSARVALMDGLPASFMSGFHGACFVAAGICWASRSAPWPCPVAPGRPSRPSRPARSSPRCRSRQALLLGARPPATRVHTAPRWAGTVWIAVTVGASARVDGWAYGGC
jgi:hypothetical protein